MNGLTIDWRKSQPKKKYQSSEPSKLNCETPARMFPKMGKVSEQHGQHAERNCRMISDAKYLFPIPVNFQSQSISNHHPRALRNARRRRCTGGNVRDAEDPVEDAARDDHLVRVTAQLRVPRERHAHYQYAHYGEGKRCCDQYFERVERVRSVASARRGCCCVILSVRF